MPTYGDEKVRDMTRSVLPSRWRNAGLAKRAVHQRARTHRRAVLAELTAWGMDIDDVDVRDEDWIGERREQIDMRYKVRHRRRLDNVGAVKRWARAKADEMGPTPQARYARLGSILGKHPMGNHALSHVTELVEYEARPQWWRYATSRVSYDAEGERAEAAAMCRRIIGDGELGDFNQMIKRAYGRMEVVPVGDGSISRTVWHAPRLLAGLHDVDDFVASWLRSRRLAGDTPFGRWREQSV